MKEETNISLDKTITHLSKSALLFLLLIPMAGWCQDSLILQSGVAIPFVKLYQYEDQIEVKTLEGNSNSSFYPKDVFGYYDILKDQSYYLLPNPEEDDNFSHIFLERFQVGTINMYVNNTRNYAIYLEKHDELRLVYSTLEPNEEKDNRIKILKEFVADDRVSINYIESKGFKFKPKEIEIVVSKYNERHFENRAPGPDDVMKKLFLYRTKFQKTKEVVRVTLFGISHNLYLEDFIQLEIPIKYPSKLTISDAFITTEKIISANLAEQYFEIIYNSRTNSYILDTKSGSELHYEFNKIKDKTRKSIKP